MRFTFVAAAYHPSTPHSSGFARLASGAFYEAISLATFYEIIIFDLWPVFPMSFPVHRAQRKVRIGEGEGNSGVDKAMDFIYQYLKVLAEASL
ncbi:MAG: hypothetical protein NTY64_14915 [Deltaproteobacteria bacterium]|nr:hypothetical protein [Deltaproteobacteria bacterium]